MDTAIAHMNVMVLWVGTSPDLLVMTPETHSCISCNVKKLYEISRLYICTLKIVIIIAIMFNRTRRTWEVVFITFKAIVWEIQAWFNLFFFI